MGYILGLDIGIASIGFAGVIPDSKAITFTAVHIFDTAENPKDGSSLALPRRSARGLRRVIRRRAQRKKHTRKLFLKYGFSKEDIAAIDLPEAAEKSPVWKLRAAALERTLTDAELARVLFHIAKRRGFQSNSKKAADNDTEGKKALEGSKQLQEAMTQDGARTVGAYLSTLPKQRNGHGSYERFVVRDLLRAEVREIFRQQEKLGNAKATAALQDEYEHIAFDQRPLQSVEKLVGKCFLEPTQKRAPRNAYSAELFVLWSRLNNLRLRGTYGDERELTMDERNRAAELAHKNKSLTYAQLRKHLDIGDDLRFNIGYRKTKDDQNTWEKIRDSAEKAKFAELKGYHAFKEALGKSEGEWQAWIGAQREKLDDIAKVLSFNDDLDEIEKLLSGMGICTADREALKKITDFKGTVDISAKAARKLLPFMQQGLVYDKACEQAGYKFNTQDNKGLSLVPQFETTRNPVVDRALSQARKVINAVIRRFGLPETIIVELANELGKNFKDRKDIERQIEKNRAYKEETRKHLEEEILKREATNEELMKYRLWKEQEGFCLYSGQYIEPELLRDPVATQIDHILPYSRSYDDSYMNKLLCLSDENQRKGNMTPYEYLKGTKAWDALESTFTGRLPKAKVERLLMKEFDADKEERWKSRHLNDTRYLSRVLKNHLENSLALGKGKRIQTRNGALTAHLRGVWGFPDKNRANDRHHGLDAIVLACSTERMVQTLTNWNKYEARKKNPAEKPRPPLPWEGFRDEAKKKVEELFVSRMPYRKISGQAHEETIRSIRQNDKGERIAIQKVRLTSLKPAALENLVDKDGRNKNLYTILKERLDAHKGDPQKAFATPVKLIGKGGEDKAAVINSVRIVTNERSGVEVNEGLASNGRMIRVDVFQKDKKFYLCPVYVHHSSQGRLPKSVIKPLKDEHEWQEMDDKYEFKFSLYPNDLVKVAKNGEEYLGYYTGTNRRTASIALIAHDSDKSFGKNGLKDGIGVQGLAVFEKYTVNYFGEMHKVKGEKRLGLAKPARAKSGKAVAQERAASAGK